MPRTADNLSASKQASKRSPSALFCQLLFVISREIQRRTIPIWGRVCRFALLWGGDAFGHRIT